MFKKVDRSDCDFVTIEFDGEKKTVPAGITVTAAAFLLGINFTRVSPNNRTRRAPYCQMGVCFECLMEINQVPNQQSCMIYVQEGMTIKRQLDQNKETRE